MRKTFLKAQAHLIEEQVVNDFLFSEVWNPSADVYETEEALIIFIELAGVKTQNLQFSINKDNVLHIWGERKAPLKELKGMPHLSLASGKEHTKGISVGTFSKYISLPVKVKKKEAEIQNINGIFKLIFKKIPDTTALICHSERSEESLC